MPFAHLQACIHDDKLMTFCNITSRHIRLFRGALICKITDIPITDILAMKITDSDTVTDTDLSISHVVSLYLKHKMFTQKILIGCYDIFKMVHSYMHL